MRIDGVVCGLGRVLMNISCQKYCTFWRWHSSSSKTSRDLCTALSSTDTRICSEESNIIQIFFQFFSCDDYVKFFLNLPRPEVDEYTPYDYLLCGSMTSPTFQHLHFSSDRSLILEFHSDYVQTNHTGFFGTYKFLDKCKILKIS